MLAPCNASREHILADTLLRAANDGYDVSPLIECGADPMASDVDGRLAIHYAAMNGHTMSVLALAAYGADINSCTKNGRTAMHGACWNGHTQTALQLVEMGADSKARSNDGATPLIDAARNGHTDAVISLVTMVGSDVSAVDRSGRGCLHFAALNGHNKMVKTLVNLSADVESKDHDGCRPLHLAAWNGNGETVKLLLRLGADPHSIDIHFSTPLHDAALSGRTSVAALLLSSSADIEARNNRGITPLHSAASSGHCDTVCLLLEAKADVNAVNDDKRSALHFATWNCHPRTVLLLLKYGADMSVCGQDGVMPSDGLCHADFDWPKDLLPELHSMRLANTPMHTAAGGGDCRRITALAGCGVDVNCANIVGDTPLHWAVRNRRLQASTRLLELGGDVTRSNDKGITVRKDVLMYMDLLEQECVKRKVVELAQQPPRTASRAAPGSLPGDSSPDNMQSPRGAKASGSRSHSSSSSSSSSRSESVHADQMCNNSLVSGAGELDIGMQRALKTMYVEGPHTPAPSPRGERTIDTSKYTRPWSPLNEACSSPRSPPDMVQPSAICSETPERESGQNPHDCNPDDVHNLASPHHQSSTHPIRYACMQVDAWARNIPGVRWWHSLSSAADAATWGQSSKTRNSTRRRPVLFVLDRPTEVSENIMWRINSTLVGYRLRRDSALQRLHQWTKSMGVVGGQVVKGDFKALTKHVGPMKLEPWLEKKARCVHCGVVNSASRWKWRVQLVSKTACAALSVVGQAVRLRPPSTVFQTFKKQGKTIVESYQQGPMLLRAE